MILLDLGEKEVPVPRPTFEMGSAFETLPLSNGTSKAIRATRMPFARGNQSESMPPRQERFADSRLEDAIADVLTQAQGPTKVEGVIRAIYVIHTTEGFHAATETINSSLSKGARAGRWKRVGRGLYEI